MVKLDYINGIKFNSTFVADEKSEIFSGIESLRLFEISGTVNISTSSKDTARKGYLFSYQDKIYDSLRLFQKLSLDNTQIYNQNLFNKSNEHLSKVESFTVHGNHYLIFISPFDCKIFWWSKSQFSEF